jgi:hypothetical protein
MACNDRTLAESHRLQNSLWLALVLFKQDSQPHPLPATSQASSKRGWVIIDNCKSCRFWIGYAAKDRKSQGECHRYPPVDNERPFHQEVFAVWIETNELNWCGEYQPQKGPNHE